MKTLCSYILNIIKYIVKYLIIQIFIRARKVESKKNIRNLYTGLNRSLY